VKSTQVEGRGAAMKELDLTEKVELDVAALGESRKGGAEHI
jgi:hypothetical protein